MSKKDSDADLVRELEQRIDQIEALEESDLGGFNRFDWLFLILIAIVIPLIAVVAAR